MEPISGRSVTWAEFVEAGLLREYRRKLNVALSELRPVIDRLREKYETPYPLTHHRPFVGPGRELLLEVQQDAGLDADLCLVAAANDQLLLTPAADAFVQRVEWAEDIAVSWRPHDDPHSPVRMASDVRFGKPAIKGISTEVLREHVESGEDFAEVAEAFDLDLEDAHWAFGLRNLGTSGVTRPGKPATVRFYFDANILGLAKIFVQVRADATYPGDPGSAIAIALLEAGVRELVIHDADASRVATLLDLLSDVGQGRASAGPPDPAGCDLVCNASPMGMEDDDPLPVDAALLSSSMFVGDVIAGHGVTPFLEAARAAGCKTANGDHMVEAAQDLMVDFMLQ